MKRPALALGAATLILAFGSGAWWLTRRAPGSPPQEEALEPFRSEPMRVGQLIDLQPPSMPLRSVRWTLPLPGGVAVAQILTQTGRQQAVLFQQGVPGPVFSLPEPPGVPDGFFRFADLADAALAPDDALVLLYRSSTDPASPSLVLACDLHSQQIRWSLRAPGEHLALSEDHRSVFLFGASTPVGILELVGRPGQPKPASTSVDLPPEVKTVSNLLPVGRRAFVVAHDSGLSTWRDGAWTHVPAPAPSPLGFPQGLGRVAGDAKGGWWQPEPGVLIPLGPGAKPGPSRDLKALLPDPSSLDASLLQLLGEEPDGHLWFGLMRPTLPAPAPMPDPTPATPPAPDDSGQVLPTPALPPATTATLQPSREDWEAYLGKGLDRLYLWKPGEERMKVVSIADAWKRLTPPPSASAFPGLGNLRPEAGALLCGGPDRIWWLPLKALRPR
ncbi:hypothetical protein [Geothrix terrae]|uniref:hypothetical protein n=1 Tax=Geothrix terrae TaxID=2922720 RepID=UPI001FACB098|nr:hypothetical protein [Geothrix terrae]